MNSNCTLYVVDDDPDICFIMKYWLTKKGYLVSVFENSKGLMTALQNIKPDLIFMDINLGSEDGRVICKRIKDYNDSIIVILFSANPNALANFQECNANDSFSKPFEYDTLQEKLNKFLNTAH